MTVPFRDAAELEAGGTAAYLRVTPGRPRSERLGGLLQVNARGDPVEFTFSTVQVPGGALWRAGEAERSGQRGLAISLFKAIQRSPLLLLCLAREFPPELFRDELEVLLPICRLAAEGDVAQLDRGEIAEQAAEPTVHRFWRPCPMVATPVWLRGTVNRSLRIDRLAIGLHRRRPARARRPQSIATASTRPG